MNSEDRSTVIYQTLWRAILEKALKPGAKLSEDTIGEHFGASRTVVRSALGRLASEGLVELRRNRGAYVATPSLEEAREIWDIRVGLERLVLERLPKGLARADAEKLKAHVDAEDKARGVDDPLAIRLATEFHILLAEMSGSKTLARYVSEVSARCGLILPRHSQPHSPGCKTNEHTEIAHALAEGDARLATELMNAHLEAVANRALLDAKPNQEKELKDILSGYPRANAAK